jgi:hypothetical protein
MSDQNLDPHKFSNPNHSLYKPPEDQENPPEEIVDSFTGQKITSTNLSDDSLISDEANQTGLSDTDDQLDGKDKEPEFLNNKPDQKGLPLIIWHIRAFLYRRKRLIRRVVLAIGILFLLSTVSVAAWLGGKYNNIRDIEARATAIEEGSIVYGRNDEEIFRFYDRYFAARSGAW